MKINLYSLKDVKAGLFMSPFGQNNDQVAIRSLKMSVNTPSGSVISNNPEDIAMFQVGTFDDATGILTSEVRFVINAIDLKAGTNVKTEESDNIEIL